MLRDLIVVFKHECRLHKNSAGTYLFFALGWVALGILTFFIGNFFALNTASVQPMLRFMPWLYLLFIPALAMSIWAQEWKGKTAERLFTLPLHPLAINLGKFLAGWFMLLILLAGTWPIVASVFWLGTPDVGPIISGYIGAFLLGGAMLALALLCSLLASGQAVAFALAVIVLFILLAAGWGLAAGLLEPFLPPSFLNALVRYGLLDRFSSFTNGLIDGRDVLFFVSLIVLFLALVQARLYIRLERRRFVPVCLLVAGLACLANLPLRHMDQRYDMTSGNVHTLEPATKNLIRNLDQDTQLTFYFSSNKSAVPYAVQQYARRVEDFLRHLEDLNPEHVSVHKIIPETEVDYELTAKAQGIRQLPLPNGQKYYFGLHLASGGRQGAVPLFDPVRAGFLEFDVVTALADLQRTKRKHIGIISELDLGNDNVRPRFMTELMAKYDVSIIGAGQPRINPDIDLVIVFFTPYIDKENVYALDQYMVSGGRMMLFLDPYLRTAPTPDLQVADRNADRLAIDHPADLLRYWGVDYDYNAVVGDVTRGLPVQTGDAGLTPYPFWLYVSEKEVDQTLPFMSYINDLYFIESGHFVLEGKREELSYQPLISTTSNAQEVSRTLFEQMPSHLISLQLNGPQKERHLSMLVRGNFPSSFEAMPKEAFEFYKYNHKAGQSVQQSIPMHKHKSTAKGMLITIGDMDFLNDQFAIEEVVKNGKQTKQPANDNLVFLFNAIQYLLGDDIAFAVRGKAVSRRPLEKLEAELVHAAQRSARMEHELAADLVQARERLQELQHQASIGNMMKDKVNQELEKFQRQKLTLQKELLALRRDVHSRIETIGRLIALVNIILMPLLTAFFALIYFWRRRRRACYS